MLEQHEGELELLRARVGELEADLPGADLDVDVKAPKVGLPGVELPKVDLEAPEVKLPGADLDVDVKAPRVGLPDVKLPEVDLEAPEVELPGADLDVDVKAPKVGLPGVELPEVDLEAPEVKLPGADLEVDVKAPKVSLPGVELPEVDLEAGVRAPGTELDLELGQRAPSQRDNLRIVEGIGPKISSVLNDNGILTFAQLAATSVERLKAILEHAGPNFQLADPTSWPEQARLAAEGAWDALKDLQIELDGGRRTSRRRR